MTDTKALCEVVSSALFNWGATKPQEAFEALVGHLQCAEADNAALLGALQRVYWAEPRGYDAAVEAVIHDAHPGAALLEEVEGLRKQVDSLKESVGLLRADRDAAHDAALEAAAVWLETEPNEDDRRPLGVVYDNCAKHIRAMKKTGQRP